MKEAAAKPATKPSASSKMSAPAKNAAKTTTAAKAAAKTEKAPAKAAAELTASETTLDMLAWILASSDNRKLPFAVIDKVAAQILVFDAEGNLKGRGPVLIGSAMGDESSPGVGDRELKDIPAEERSTPAGRYAVGFGPAAGGKSVLWVDYATAISIHAVPQTTAARKEKRDQRLASKKSDDNRITHGCVNVSSTFYSKTIRPTFRKGGVFYVLPDSVPLQTAFPAFEPRPANDSFAGAE